MAKTCFGTEVASPALMVNPGDLQLCYGHISEGSPAEICSPHISPISLLPRGPSGGTLPVQPPACPHTAPCSGQPQPPFRAARAPQFAADAGAALCILLEVLSLWRLDAASPLVCCPSISIRSDPAAFMFFTDFNSNHSEVVLNVRRKRCTAKANFQKPLWSAVAFVNFLTITRDFSSISYQVCVIVTVPLENIRERERDKSLCPLGWLQITPNCSSSPGGRWHCEE